MQFFVCIEYFFDITIVQPSLTSSESSADRPSLKIEYVASREHMVKIRMSLKSIPTDNPLDICTEHSLAVPVPLLLRARPECHRTLLTVENPLLLVGCTPAQLLRVLSTFLKDQQVK